MTLLSLFHPICQEVQTKLKGALRGLFGGMVRGYLPQAWIFRTESETVTFMVDKAGNASVVEGEAEAPDVVIDVDYEYICEALRTRKKPGFEYKTFRVQFMTGKGQTAFNYIRDQIGL